MSDQWFSVREAPYGGNLLEKSPDSIEDALTASGLDWEVLSKPAYFLDNPEEVEEDEDAIMTVSPFEGYFVNVRSDTNQPLGFVSKRYAQFHNLQAFGFLSHVFQSEMDFVAAGHFMNSRRVWVLMQLPTFIEVGGDNIGQFAFVHTSHDGKHSVTASMTPYRWLCANMVPSDVRKARELNAKRVITLRHMGDMESKVAALEAERVLDFTVNYYEQFRVLGNKLAEKKPTKREIKTYIEALIEIPEDQGDRAQANAEINRDTIEKIFKGKGPDGDTQGNAPGSWWALYNAAVEFAQWVRPERKKDGRFQRTIDDPDGFASDAFDLALGGAKL